MLDTIIHKTQDEDKQNQKHNTIYARHHHTPDEDKQSKTTTQYLLDTTMHQTQNEDKHKMTEL